ncbi:S-layer homology domain-containing protein [Bacillus solitudinis]|uniref:S-layer homology domain-containing protein n=1 Tax=Bacillus solitudinis TaxID=2014074 RepID=UPI000C232F27|nr:S-layer homology domain-containing protein [Bacillus solitudinis]
MKVTMLVAVLVLMVMPINAIASKSFSDVTSGHWAKLEIEFLANKGIIGGYANGTFKPSQSITRIQAAAMITKALGLTKSGDQEPEFKDISTKFPNRDVVAIMEETGIMRGSDGKFRPYETVTRGQMAAILTRSFQLEKVDSVYFTDILPEHWVFADIGAVAAKGIAGGRPDGSFGASQATTRAHFSAFLYRALNEEKRLNGRLPLGEDAGSFVAKGDWVYHIEDYALQKENLRTGERVTILDRFDIKDDYDTNQGGDVSFGGVGFSTGSQIQVKDGWIYYPVNYRINMQYSEYDLYRVREDGTGKEKIANYAYQYRIIGDKIYAISTGDIRWENNRYFVEVVEMDLNGRNKKIIAKPNIRYVMSGSLTSPNYYMADYLGEELIYSNSTEIRALNLKTKKERRLYKGEVDRMVLIGHLFYVESNGNILRLSINGNKEKIEKGRELIKNETATETYLSYEANGQGKLFLVEGNGTLKEIHVGGKIQPVEATLDYSFAFFIKGGGMEVVDLKNRSKVHAFLPGFYRVEKVLVLANTYYFGGNYRAISAAVSNDFKTVKPLDHSIEWGKPFDGSYYGQLFLENGARFFALHDDKQVYSEAVKGYIPDFKVRGGEVFFASEFSLDASFYKMDKQTGATVEIIGEDNPSMFESAFAVDSNYLYVIARKDNFEYDLVAFDFEGKEIRRISLPAKQPYSILEIEGDNLLLYRYEEQYLKQAPNLIVDLNTFTY